MRWMPCSVASATSARWSPAGGEFTLLERGPQQFHRVQLGSVGGSSLQGEPVLLGDPGAHRPAPVGGQAVPDQHHSLTGVEHLHLLQDLDEPGGLVVAGLEVEAQTGPTIGVGGVVAQPRPSTPASSSNGAAGAESALGARRCGGSEAAGRRLIRRGRRSRHMCSRPPFDARPLVRDPAGDLGLVPLDRAPFRTLQAILTLERQR